MGASGVLCVSTIGLQFISHLKSRLVNRVQVTTDGHKMYAEAVEQAFGSEVDYAMLVKFYGQELEPQRRYSPAKCSGAEKHRVAGNPSTKAISTSFVERQNLTMRMQMRRFTRLTNGFSKKVENLNYAIALHFMYYNFCRIHKTLGKTPAMVAGIAKWPWTHEDIVSLIDKAEYVRGD